MEIVSEYNDNRISAGDYPFTGGNQNVGNDYTYQGYYVSQKTSAVEPCDMRFVGKSYNTDINRIIAPPWTWVGKTNSWHGVTDKTKCYLSLPYKGNRI